MLFETGHKKYRIFKVIDSSTLGLKKSVVNKNQTFIPETMLVTLSTEKKYRRKHLWHVVL